MSAEEQKRLDERKRGLAGLIEDLEAGVIDPEDFDKDTIQKLEDLLRKNK